MKNTEIDKTLKNFKQTLNKLLPEREKQIGSVWLNLKELYGEMLLNDKTKFSKKSLSYKDKKINNLDNLLEICITSIKLTNKNDMKGLSRALGYMDAKLFDIEINAHNARKKITVIMNKIADKII